MHGARDIRVESFTLPPLAEGALCARIVTDSVCTATYKALLQGSEHKRVPKDTASRPVITGGGLWNAQAERIVLDESPDVA